MNGVNKGKGKLGEDELQTEQRKVLEVNELVERVRQNWRAARWTSEIADELRSERCLKWQEPWMRRQAYVNAAQWRGTIMMRRNSTELRYSIAKVRDFEKSEDNAQNFKNLENGLRSWMDIIEFSIDSLADAQCVHYDDFELLLHRNSTVASMLLHIIP